MPFFKTSDRSCLWCGDEFTTDVESEDCCCSFRCADKLEAFEKSEPQRLALALAEVADLDPATPADAKAWIFRQVFESPIEGAA